MLILLIKKKLVRGTLTSLTYESMKKQLKAIYDSSLESAKSASLELKKKYFFQSLTVTMIIIKREISSNKIIEDIKKIVVVNIKKKVIVIKKTA